jgi:hypothetical protein
MGKNKKDAMVKYAAACRRFQFSGKIDRILIRAFVQTGAAPVFVGTPLGGDLPVLPGCRPAVGPCSVLVRSNRAVQVRASLMPETAAAMGFPEMLL